MTEQDQNFPPHRTLDMDVRSLILHLQRHAAQLYDDARLNHYPDEVVRLALENLEAELNRLRNLPPEMTLQEIMERHEETKTKDIQIVAPHKREPDMEVFEQIEKEMGDKTRMREAWNALKQNFSELSQGSPFIRSLIDKVTERVILFRSEGSLGDSDVPDSPDELLFLPPRPQGSELEGLYARISKDNLTTLTESPKDDKLAWLMYDPRAMVYTYASLDSYDGPEMSIAQFTLSAPPSSPHIQDLLGRFEAELVDGSLEISNTKKITVTREGVEYSEYTPEKMDYDEKISLDEALARLAPNKITRTELN